MSFTWRFVPDDTGVEIDPVDRNFPSQSDAESWVGEHWRRLSEAGVESVELVENGASLYDMALTAD
ncbi:MAG: hypothetical protein JWM76_2339 [Pseudonocardiales bacterium]|nr:hypothetical protein [Pseudonocardiales bacterium]